MNFITESGGPTSDIELSSIGIYSLFTRIVIAAFCAYRVSPTCRLVISRQAIREKKYQTDKSLN